jgi:hypothetical protein
MKLILNARSDFINGALTLLVAAVFKPTLTVAFSKWKLSCRAREMAISGKVRVPGARMNILERVTCHLREPVMLMGIILTALSVLGTLIIGFAATGITVEKNRQIMAKGQTVVPGTYNKSLEAADRSSCLRTVGDALPSYTFNRSWVHPVTGSVLCEGKSLVTITEFNATSLGQLTVKKTFVVDESTTKYIRFQRQVYAIGQLSDEGIVMCWRTNTEFVKGEKCVVWEGPDSNGPVYESGDATVISGSAGLGYGLALPNVWNTVARAIDTGFKWKSALRGRIEGLAKDADAIENLENLQTVLFVMSMTHIFTTGVGVDALSDLQTFSRYFLRIGDDTFVESYEARVTEVDVPLLVVSVILMSSWLIVAIGSRVLKPKGPSAIFQRDWNDPSEMANLAIRMGQPGQCAEERDPAYWVRLQDLGTHNHLEVTSCTPAAGKPDWSKRCLGDDDAYEEYRWVDMIIAERECVKVEASTGGGGGGRRLPAAAADSPSGGVREARSAEWRKTGGHRSSILSKWRTQRTIRTNRRLRARIAAFHASSAGLNEVVIT